MKLFFVLIAITSCLTSNNPFALPMYTCPAGPLMLQLDNFRVIDQITGTDLQKINVYHNTYLTIVGKMSTAAEIVSGTYTASIRVSVHGLVSYFGFMAPFKSELDCLDPEMQTPYDPKLCLETVSCEQLEALFGADVIFCPGISRTFNFYAPDLEVKAKQPGSLPPLINSVINPSLEVQVEIFDDYGGLIFCIVKNFALDLSV